MSDRLSAIFTAKMNEIRQEMSQKFATLSDAQTARSPHGEQKHGSPLIARTYRQDVFLLASIHLL